MDEPVSNSNSGPQNGRGYTYRQRDEQALVALAVRISPELKKALKRVCVEDGRTINYMVERAIVNYLADNYPDYLPEEML